MSQQEQIVAVATAELGLIEGPKENQTKYQKTNQPWCGAFVNWVFKEVGVKIPNCVSTLAGATAFKKNNTAPDKKGDQRNGGQVCEKVRAYKKKNRGKLKPSLPVHIVGFGKPTFKES
jgi:hypothetical protein